MNVLITGSAGFIGKAVSRILTNAGHNVRPFDRVSGSDVKNKYCCHEAMRGMDAVIHLAGVLGTDELFDEVQTAIDINIKGAVNILDACVAHGAKYIGITMLPVFPSIYTATKISSQRFATAYHHNYGMPVTHVRAFNAFGPGQAHGPGHPRKIIPALSVEGWSNIPLKIWGDGEQTVDLIHVNQIARIFLDALEKAPGQDEVIDAGTGEAWSVNQVADFVLDITGSISGVEHLPMRRGETPTNVVASGEGWDYLTELPRLDRIELMKTIVAYRNYKKI